MLAGFDIGPLGREDINGPPWLGFLAGGIFAIASLAMIAGPLAGGLFGILVLAGLAAIGNGIAFGAGECACSGSISCPGCGAKAIFRAWPVVSPSASAH